MKNVRYRSLFYRRDYYISPLVLVILKHFLPQFQQVLKPEEEVLNLLFMIKDRHVSVYVYVTFVHIARKWCAMNSLLPSDTGARKSASSASAKVLSPVNVGELILREDVPVCQTAAQKRIRVNELVAGPTASPFPGTPRVLKFSFRGSIWREKVRVI